VAFFAGGTTSTGDTAAFKVTNDGALTATNATITGAVTATSGSFTGTISASAGQIGGWAIGSDRITNLGATKYAGIIDTALDTDLAFFAGATSSSGAAAFYSVTNAGALTATDATISGSVTATVGAIGGWLLTSTSLTSSNTTISSTGDITLGTGSNVARLSSSDPVYRLWLGATTGSAAPFSVTSTGSISASAGTIGGFSLSSASLTAGTGASAVGLLPGTFPFFAGNSTASSAPFRVSSEGDVTASKATITGGAISIGSFFSVVSTGATTLSSLTVSSADGTRPGVYINKSSTVGDIGVPTGQVFNVGHWSGSAFTERLRLDASGQMRLYDGYFAVGRSSDVFRVDTSGLVSVGNGTSVAGDLRVYGNGSSGSNGAVRIYGGTPGTTNGGTISWDSANSRFNMNNDLNIAGAFTGATTIAASSNITATGRVHGTSGTGNGNYFTRTWVDTNADPSGGTAPTASMMAAGDMAIFTQSGAVRLYVESFAGSVFYVSVSNASDIRLKQNISDYSGALNKILSMRPVTFNWKETPEGKTQIGLIAQDLKEIEPSLVDIQDIAEPDPRMREITDGQLLMPDIDGTKALAISAAAIKEMYTEFTALKARVAVLENA
jgi:hypothetical protein